MKNLCIKIWKILDQPHNYLIMVGLLFIAIGTLLMLEIQIPLWYFIFVIIAIVWNFMIFLKKSKGK